MPISFGLVDKSHLFVGIHGKANLRHGQAKDEEEMAQDTPGVPMRAYTMWTATHSHAGTDGELQVRGAWAW